MRIYKEPGQEPVFLMENIDAQALEIKSEYGDWASAIRHILEGEWMLEPEQFNRLVNCAFGLWGKEMFEKESEDGVMGGWNLDGEEDEE